MGGAFRFPGSEPRRRHRVPIAIERQRSRCAEIIRKLVFFFAGRRCANPEDLAMETVLRVASKCRDVDVSSYADRVGYFFGVARNVVHEEHRSALRESKALESFLREIYAHACGS